MIPFKGLKKKDIPKTEQDDHKKSIQSSLKREIGILVDKPKPGYGLTNTGNVARKFFENHLIASRILGIETTLVENFRNLLKMISS